MDCEYGMGTFGDLLPASSYHKSINIINGTWYAKWNSYVITTLLKRKIANIENSDTQQG